MFFADEYYGFDDALYACARLLRILAESGKTLAELLQDLPHTYVTPEIRIACPEEEKPYYVSKAKKYFVGSGYKTIEIDGVRVQFPDGWGLVRASNTGPELIVRCEAQSPEGLERIKGEIASSISPLRME